MKDNSRVPREAIDDDDPRLGQGWSPWMNASSETKAVDAGMISDKLPKEAGLYEWRFYNPKSGNSQVRPNG